MNKSIIGAIFAISTIAASCAAHAALPGDATVAVPGHARSGYTLGASEFASFANSYTLGNGQVATFTQRGNHYYVQLKSTQRDGGAAQAVATRLRPVGPDTFVTDGGAQLTFRDGGDQVAVDNFERLPEARVAAHALNVRMVASR